MNIGKRTALAILWAVAAAGTNFAQNPLPNYPIGIQHFRAEKTDGGTGVFHSGDSIVFKYRLVNRSTAVSLATLDTLTLPIFYSVVGATGDTLVPRDTFNVHRFANITFPPSSTIGSFELRTKITKLRIFSGGGVIIVWPGIANPAPNDTLHIEVNVAVDAPGTARTVPLKPDDFDVYPVPVRNTMTITAPAPIVSAVLTDVSGKTWGRYTGSTDVQIVWDTCNLPAGVYLLQWRCADGRSAVRKIVVQ